MNIGIKILFLCVFMVLIRTNEVKAQEDESLLEGYRYETPSGQRIPTNIGTDPINTEKDELLQMNRPYDPNYEIYQIPEE